MAPDANGARDRSEEATTWKRSQLGAHTVRIKIGDREELPVRSMQAKVAIDGFLARVVLDLVVRNDRDSTYEGTFQLRLPEGASPYFFAFGEDVLAIAGDAQPAFFRAEQARDMGVEPADIMSGRSAVWRGPKEARVVPKETAALAYGATVRRAVDPALLEWSGPSVFSARVFPLTGQRSHRIVIGYDVPLTRIGEDLEYTFDLPGSVGSKVVDIAVATAAGAAVDVKPGAQALEHAGRRHYRFEDPGANALALRIKKPGALHLTAADAHTGPYFAADIAPAIQSTLGGSAGASPATPPNPQSAGAARGAEAALFLVDTSLSSNPDRFNIWLRLLESVLKNNRDTLKRFNVMFFNIEQGFFKPGFVENNDASVSELLAHANTLALEGATDLFAALRRAAGAPGAEQAGAPARWDVFLLSDGASTWGESDPFALTRLLAGSPVGAVYSYRTGLAGTDTEVLSLLARETGGAVFSVTGDAEVGRASTAHRSRPLRILEAKVAGGADIMLAGRPRFFFPGQTLRVVGRGAPSKGAALELTLEAGGEKQTVRAPLGEALASPLALRAYGQVAVAQLEELLPATGDPARAYATHFRVPGKTCSLLMLESEADYQRFGIRPEDNARVIQQKDASRVVAEILSRVAGALGNPKLAFLRWLDGLAQVPGVTFKELSGLRGWLERMPESSFRVEAAPLAVKRRDRAAIPDAVQQSLRKHDLDYDVISAEAQRRRQSLGPADALRALSSLVEENPGDAVLARDVAVSAMTWGLSADAYHLFRRVAAARPYEPQTYRGLAQALARLGHSDLAMAYFEVGLAGQWDQRFGDFHRILGVEYLELLRRVVNGQAKTSVPDLVVKRLDAVSSAIQLGRADMVVMITWNTDATDVDLHVIEPSGEECFYGHSRTQSGGQITADVTQGYGPEMFVLPGAPAGRYVIRAKYYASDRNRASARTKVHAVIIEDYGTGRQRMTDKVVTLEYNKDMHELLQVVRGASAQVAGP
jgi:hypothetical protein